MSALASTDGLDGLPPEAIPPTRWTGMSSLASSLDLTGKGTLLAVKALEEEVSLAFDETPFHARGGGQPADHGVIAEIGGTAELSIVAVEVERDTGVIWHRVKPVPVGKVCVGGSWDLKVDPNRRLKMSKYHSAGHMVDSAMSRCGYDFPPIKGQHDPENGPAVEYVGSIPPADRAPLVTRLNEEFEKIVKEELPTVICQMTKEEFADRDTKRIFDLGVFKDPEIRVVTVAGFSCPCGGTHVESTKELSEFEVTGIKVKKNVTKIKYDLKKAT